MSSRHLVENVFLELKRWRGIATRYAKNTSSFLAAAQASRASLRESWGVRAQGQQFFAALETVLDAPTFRAAWRDEKKQAVAVEEFLGLGPAYGGVRESGRVRHGGYSPDKEFHTPWNPPKK